MRKFTLAVLAIIALGMAGAALAQQQPGGMNMEEGITKALNMYIDAAIKGDSKIAAPAFAPMATMSYTENGKLVTVPIAELFAYYDKTGPHPASYEVTSAKVEGDVAVVSIDSKFGDVRFDDMFTLVKDGDNWKIVSKVYHIK